ncbi:hypothetical protein NDU88_001395 [Pleurodeles waltl]|uniref:Uncharacterized protein n=1 Tax=Pleurodeles waltl TaxID=8319 RepID=A0AAV7NE37_PLEWA|nr:hypothetical protein NDU88_001395 [Pleurodeles waltl]
MTAQPGAGARRRGPQLHEQRSASKERAATHHHRCLARKRDQEAQEFYMPGPGQPTPSQLGRKALVGAPAGPRRKRPQKGLRRCYRG